MPVARSVKAGGKSKETKEHSHIVGVVDVRYGHGQVNEPLDGPAPTVQRPRLRRSGRMERKRRHALGKELRNEAIIVRVLSDILLRVEAEFNASTRLELPKSCMTEEAAESVKSFIWRVAQLERRRALVGRSRRMWRGFRECLNALQREDLHRGCMVIMASDLDDGPKAETLVGQVRARCLDRAVRLVEGVATRLQLARIAGASRASRVAIIAISDARGAESELQLCLKLIDDDKKTEK